MPTTPGTQAMEELKKRLDTMDEKLEVVRDLIAQGLHAALTHRGPEEISSDLVGAIVEVTAVRGMLRDDRIAANLVGDEAFLREQANPYRVDTTHRDS